MGSYGSQPMPNHGDGMSTCLAGHHSQTVRLQLVRDIESPRLGILPSFSSSQLILSSNQPVDYTIHRY